jgi:HNH endonuclease
VNPHYALVAERAAHRCEYCRAPEAIFNFPFEVEHAIPPRHGGTDDPANLALACRACNLRKSDHVRALDFETQTSARLFHPRQDAWNNHFEVDTASGAINGRTATGRATVACLQMNAPPQLAARVAWMRLGLFP